jgi:hypothetical protein
LMCVAACRASSFRYGQNPSLSTRPQFASSDTITRKDEMENTTGWCPITTNECVEKSIACGKQCCFRAHRSSVLLQATLVLRCSWVAESRLVTFCVS